MKVDITFKEEDYDGVINQTSTIMKFKKLKIEDNELFIVAEDGHMFSCSVEDFEYLEIFKEKIWK